MDLNAKLQQAYKIIRSAQKILLVGHLLPDPDALASVGAMIELVRFCGGEVRAFCSQKPDKDFDYIPHAQEITPFLSEGLENFDLVIILDCGAISRTALEADIQNILLKDPGERPFIIELDHHEQQLGYADLEIRLPDRASTTEIVYQLLRANNLPINKVMADCILIGLVSDTGNFLHANASQQALALASEMLLRGASLPHIINHIINNKSLGSLKIWGYALEHLQINPVTGLATVAFPEAAIGMLRQASGPDFDGEVFGDIVAFVSRLEGVRVSLLLREEGGYVKGSLRTVRQEIDVAQLAGNWGGGGHKKAAGFAVAGRLVPSASGWKVVRG